MSRLDELRDEVARLEAQAVAQAKAQATQTMDAQQSKLDPPITAEEQRKYRNYVAGCREEPWPLEKFVDLAIRRWGHLLDIG